MNLKELSLNQLVGDFIPEPRCSKFAVGLQTEGRKMGGYKRSGRTLV